MANARKHNEKMKQKKALKAAKRALYESYAGTGKRAKKQSKKSPVSGIHKHAHIMQDCGNPGCSKCYPR